MTAPSSRTNISQKGMVASPRFKTRPTSLADAIFGSELDMEVFVQRFRQMND